MGGCVSQTSIHSLDQAADPELPHIVDHPTLPADRDLQQDLGVRGIGTSVYESPSLAYESPTSECLTLRLKLEESQRKIESLKEVILRLTQSLDSLPSTQVNVENLENSSSLDFDEEREDEENIRSFFEILANGENFLQQSAVENAKTVLVNRILNNENACDEWDRLAKALGSEIKKTINGQGIDFDKFNQIVMTEIPKLPGRVHWAQSLGFGNLLAKYLNPGSVFDGQQGIKEMTEIEINVACAAFVRQAPSIIVGAWKRLREGKVQSAEEANSKFAMTEGAYAGRFATLDDFYRGVEHRLGQPNPKLNEGMRNEHCARPNAGTWFLAPNYGLCSKARWEWQWAEQADEATQADLRERLAAHAGKYPGENGDRCSQTCVSIFVKEVAPGYGGSGDSEPSPAPSAMVERLNRELKANLESESVGFLEAGEEQARGVTITDPAKIHGSSVDIGLMLPFGAAALTKSRLDILTEAVGYVCGVEATCVAVSEAVEKAWEYCRYTSDTRLRAGIERLILGELPSAVTTLVVELGLSAEHASACETAANDALRSAGSEAVTVREYLTAFGGEADALREMVETLVRGHGEQTREWAARHQYRRQGRSRDGTIALLMARHDVEPVVTSAGLRPEEFRALRLYTGPLYILYNAVMRDFPANVVERLAGNRFETTVFVIVSGITKLAKVTPVPPRRLLYRGLGGMLLPEHFWKKTAQGFLGGVELGLMSTTAERRVAIQYSGHEKKRATMLEIQAGRIDVGASLGFLSQYASEEEFLMQPLSCLEVTSRPRIDHTEQGEVLVVPVRVNVNLKSVTVEELTERRKVLHMAMAKNLQEELSYEAAAAIEQFLATAGRRSRQVAEVVTGQADVDPDGYTVAFSKDAAAGLPYAPCASGTLYFEVEVMKPKDGVWNRRSMVCLGVAGSCYMQRAKPKAGILMGTDRASWAVFSTSDSDEIGTFRAHDFDFHRDGMPSSWGRQLQPGDVAGVLCDLDRGALSISVNGSFAPPFGEVFGSGVRPGRAVGCGLFPVFGGEGVTLGYNSGADPAGRPLRFAPAEAACGGSGAARPAPDAEGLGLDAASLVGRFRHLRVAHSALDAARFNEDQRYKELVNEALDLKVHLLGRQRAAIALCQAGAGKEQLQLCAAAPCEDFGGGGLEDECPYTWPDVFSGYFAYKPLVEIPLGLAPALAALVWEAVFAAGGAVLEVKLGTEVLPSAAVLRERLCLTSARLQYVKYGAAVTGLVMASRTLTDLDLRGNEFTSAVTERLTGAAALSAAVVVMNGCSLAAVEDGEARAGLRRAYAAGCSLSTPLFQDLHFGPGKDLESCVRRVRKGKQAVGLKALGAWLDRARWTFVLARVQALDWRELDLKGQGMKRPGSAALADSLAQLTSLRRLDVQRNELAADAVAAVASGLAGLTRLRELDLRFNGLGADGWQSALNGIARCTWLETLNGGSAAWYHGLGAPALAALDCGARDLGEDGTHIVGILALRPSAGSLTAVDLGGNALSEKGGAALEAVLGSLSSLRQLLLGYNDLGIKGGAAVARGLRGANAVEVLDLQANSLYDGGGSAVAGALPGLARLRELYLQYNELGRDTARALAAALPSVGRLEVLDLDGNKLDSAAAVTLAEGVSALSTLRVLDLQRNRMGPEEAAGEWRRCLSHLGELTVVAGDGLVDADPGD